MNKLIYVVDDEPDILELLSLHLKKAGFKVQCFENAVRFMAQLKIQKPDLIILDLMLPDEDGLDVCKKLKRDEFYLSIPIIMLTAKGEEIDKILGLELGADDYITKPFSVKELVARVKAVMRRPKAISSREKIEIRNLVIIDPEKHEVIVEGKKIDLTSTEFRILKLLASKKGWVFSREHILDQLWGQEKYVVDRTVDVHIKHLREKLGRAAILIKNIRGVGYKLEE